MSSPLPDVYLDWNATTPPHPDVALAMAEAARHAWGNPSSIHRQGRLARALVDGCRERVAEFCGMHHRNVALTSGGTEANNLALHDAPALATSRIEHPSVVKLAERLEARGTPVVWLPVPETGRLDAAEVGLALDTLPPGAWVALMAVNHETGVIQPVPEVAELCRRRGARLHVDAVQAVGKIAFQDYSGAHSYAVAAHKLRGPKGIGALVWEGRAPTPLQLGGQQERGLRPGTQDASLAAGFTVALERAAVGPERTRGLGPLRDLVESALVSHGGVNGTLAARVPHVTNLSLRGWSGPEFVAAADLAGVCLSSGSACSAGTSEPSPVIQAMLGRSRAESAIRISLGEETTPDALRRAIAVFHRVLAGKAFDSPSPVT